VTFVDDKTLIVLGSDSIKIWTFDGTEWKPQATRGVNPDGRVSTIAVSSDGKTLAFFGPKAKAVFLVDTTKEKFEQEKPKQLSTLLQHPDGLLAMSWYKSEALATVALDNTVRIWKKPVLDDKVEVRTKPDLELTKGLNKVFSVAWSPDGKYLATGQDDGTLRIWDITKPDAPVATLEKTVKSLRALAFDPTAAAGSYTLAAGGDQDKPNGFPSALKVYTWKPGDKAPKEIKSYDSVGGDPLTSVTNLVALRNGKLGLGTAPLGGVGAAVIDKFGGDKTVFDSSRRPLSMDFSPDGTKLLMVQDSETVVMMDVNTGKVIDTKIKP
jgi:WD40 repeat protein